MLKVGEKIKEARWSMAPSKIEAPVMERCFSVNGAKECSVALTSLGFFELCLNGERVGDEYFLPLHSIYHALNFRKMTYPIKDKLTYRAYYSTYDLLPYLKEGENLLEIRLGNGFYRQKERICEGDWCYGESLGALYAIGITDSFGERYLLSDGSENVKACGIMSSDLFTGEYFVQGDDKRSFSFNFVPTTRELPDTLLTPAEKCADKIIKRIKPNLVYSDGERKIYDAGINVSGFATIKTKAKNGKEIYVSYAENMKDGRLDYSSTGADCICRSGLKQVMCDIYVSDGKHRILQPSFVWHAFRYIEVSDGNTEVDSVAVIHADVDVTSHFDSSSPELNWLYNAYVRTQLNNMHCGFPSDCPHRERLGYTGDGQVCSFAAMTTLDGREFYRKWIRDIFDSQDTVSGHVNHTAPFAGGGGGPGGWGSAAIIVPYNYYKIYADKSVLFEYYDRMKLFIGYLLSRRNGGLVTREEKGGWCLGDWATPEKCVIPEPLVNTAYLVHDLECMLDIAKIIDSEEDIPHFERMIKRTRKALKTAYFNSDDGSMADGAQGADAYGIFAGVSDERAIGRLKKKYAELGRFDTGFLGTYILLGVLFDYGCENEAYELLTSHKLGSFGYMMDMGATTVYETWSGDSSHDHPMLGASVEYLFTRILGITQSSESAGYTELIIAPKIPDKLHRAKGGVRLPKGDVTVSFTKSDDRIHFEISLPKGQRAIFVFNDKELVLTKKKNCFDI